MLRYFRTIRGKVIASVVIINTLLMIFFISYNTVRDYNLMLSQEGKTIHYALSVLSTNLSPWLLNNDFASLNDLVDNAKKFDGFRYASILDISGGVAVSSDNSPLNQVLYDEHGAKLMEAVRSNNSFAQVVHDDLVDVIYPICSSGKTIGYIRAVFDRDHISSALKSLLLKAVFYSFFAVLLGALFTWALMETFNKRIKRLTNSAVKIS